MDYTLQSLFLAVLIQRGLPGWFPYNSVSVMQPMYTKTANIAIAKELKTLDQYSLEDPKPPKTPVFINTWEGIKEVLNNHQSFPLGWGSVLNQVFCGKKDLSWFMLAGDQPKNYEHRKEMQKAVSKIDSLGACLEDFVERVGSRLIEKEAFKLKGDLHQIDIIRDVAIPLNTQLTADLFYMDLRTEESPEGAIGVAELYKSLVNLRIWATNNTDPAESWNRRRRAAEGANVVIDSTRKLVDEVVAGRGLGFGISSHLAKKHGRQSNFNKVSLRACGYKLLDSLLGMGHSPEKVTDEMWLMAFGEIGVLVTTFYEVMEFFLIVNIAEAARNNDKVPNADKFDPTREQPEITGYSYGRHECFGRLFAVTFITGLVKLVAGLKNLRPAPGNMGVVKKIQVGSEKIYLNDSWAYFAFNVNTWKVQFDGYGKGTFEGNKDASGGMEMQQYYAMLKKRKSEWMS